MLSVANAATYSVYAPPAVENAMSDPGLTLKQIIGAPQRGHSGACTQKAAAAEGEVRHAAELVQRVVQLRGQRAARRRQLLAQMLRGGLQHGARDVALRVLFTHESSVSNVPRAMPAKRCSTGSMCR